MCAGTANEISAAVFRVLLEEYGGGRLPRKHSTFYQQMMLQLELRTGGRGVGSKRVAGAVKGLLLCAC